MTEDTSNVVDVDQYEARDEADPIHESAMAFFLAKAANQPKSANQPATNSDPRR